MIRVLPRVLFVLPSFAGGGAERVTLTLLRVLDPERFSISLTVLDGQGPLSKLMPKHVSLTDMATPRLRYALPALIAAIRRDRPDIVFSTLGYINLALLAARPLLPKNTKIVVREANMPSLSLPGASHPSLFRVAYRMLYPLADAVICTSAKMADEMIRDFSVFPARIFQLANPVDETAIRRAATPMMREEGEGLRLVAAGRLTRQKGFDRMIDMMVALDPSSYLTIFGEGPDRAELEAQVKNLGLEDRVRFAGFCDNPWAYYAGADAFVMPSRWEGLPNAALEALACGTPVIATPESGGIDEVAVAARPGVVRIAEAGASFRAVLAGLKPDFAFALTPRPSLLPDRYQVSAVSAAFQDVLSRLY